MQRLLPVRKKNKDPPSSPTWNFCCTNGECYSSRAPFLFSKAHTHMYMCVSAAHLCCKQVGKHSLAISKDMRVLFVPFFFFFGCTDGDDDSLQSHLLPLLFNSLLTLFRTSCTCGCCVKILF
jgi:hypothetical protein